MAGNLFVLPKQVPIDGGVVVPGAKATFSKTGTSTLQNTFTDILLATPHANPVVADSDGVFAPIYFDPAFVDYRLKLTDSADVLIYQVDDVPASQAGQSLTLTDAAPFIDLIESDAALNNTSWRIQVNSEQFTLQVANDVLAAFTNILTIDRTLNVVDTIDLLPTTLLHNTLPLGATTGTFLATWVGFTTSPTTTWNFTKIGSVVTLHANNAFSATSDSILFESGATDVPASLRPSEPEVKGLYIIEENGTTQLGVVIITTAGKIFFRSDVGGAVFTASGAKGHTNQLCFTYLVD